MNKRIDLQPAYILHSRPYRDTSLLMELFTIDHGRISCVARGVRGGKSRYPGLLQLFYPLIVSLTGRGELLTLTYAETKGQLNRLRGSVLFSAWYLNELLMHVLHKHDPHPDLFQQYERTLSDLVIALNVQKSLRLFEVSLLRSLGYGLHLTLEANSLRAIDSDLYYHYHSQKGFLLETDYKRHDFCYWGSSLLALARGELTDLRHLSDSKRLLRDALKDLLGEKQIRSRKLLLPYSGENY